MNELFYFQNIAQEMIEADRDRDQMLRAMDDMWHNRWSLPPNVAGLRWIHKVVSSDPHDAIRAGTRVLSSVAPRISVQSRAPKGRAQAEKIERALGWHFRNANRRRRASVLRDVVLSALLYDEVIAQVVYLPEQIQAMKETKDAGQRLEAASKFGPFAIIVRNPQQVHVRYSDWMPEAVLMKKVMTVQEAVDFWGEKAEGLVREPSGRLLRNFASLSSLGTGSRNDGEKGARNDRKGSAARNDGRAKRRNGGITHCTVYDYTDVEQRTVWAIPQVDAAALTEPGGCGAIEILREEHGLGFLPWAAKVGGTTLEEGGHQRIPLLYSVFAAGHWDTQNIVETLLTSEVIAYAAAPRLKVEGPTDHVDVDYGEPGRTAHVPPGHALNPMAPPAMDQGLAIIAQRVAERIGKSTVPRVLQTGDFPGGTAFATLNLATQSGIKALAPYKELAEDALAEVFKLMLNWLHSSGKSLEGFGSGRDGEAIKIGPRDLDPSQIVIDVELTADVPTDRMARINAASMAVRDLGYSRERALEQIGESDPKEVMQEAEREELRAVDLEIEKQRRFRAAGITDPTPAATQPPLPSRGEGQGMDTKLGGLPAVMANPEDVALSKTKDED